MPLLTHSLEALDRYDSVYVSPHAADAVRACAARMVTERERGLKILVVTLFGDDPGYGAELALDRLKLSLPGAADRDRAHSRLHSVLYERLPADDECAHRTARVLDEIGQRSHARHVYVPLGVGGHVDHRVAHDAGVRAFQGMRARDVFFYEDRPFADLPGAVRLRLGDLGASLPPGAQHVPPSPSLPGFLLRFGTAGYLADNGHRWSERLECVRPAVRSWRQARAWRPNKALGLRLQPVLQEPAAGAEALRRLARETAGAAVCGGPEGPPRHDGERYWLLLPQREDGRFVAPPLAGVAAEAS